MKYIVKVFLLLLLSVQFYGCTDREVIDGKGIHYTLPKVDNLKYTKVGNDVTLSWTMPNNVPEVFKRPLSVSIQKIENGIYTEKQLIEKEGTTSNKITLDANKTYRFVVKVVGSLKSDAEQPGISSTIYSDGVVLEIK